VDRELAGEWRILKAKVRHVVDRVCRFAEHLVPDIETFDAIETLRICALDYIDGKPPRVAPAEMLYALTRVLELESDAT
jgi:hypothetical protein